MADIFVGDIGTSFSVTIKDKATSNIIPLQNATIKTFTLQRPNGSKVSRDALFATNGTDGKLKFITIDGDITLPGSYRLQAYVELPDGHWYTSIVNITAEPHL
jgi:hypothetical protein